MERAGIPMRLKHREDLMKITRFCRPERCADLRRMVGIIVDHGYAVARLHLEPAVDAAEGFKSTGNQACLQTDIPSRSKSGGGIQDVMYAGNVKLESLNAASIEPEGESGTKALRLNVGDSNIGRRGGPIRDDS